jgi:hypothetical protein
VHSAGPYFVARHSVARLLYQSSCARDPFLEPVSATMGAYQLNNHRFIVASEQKGAGPRGKIGGFLLALAIFVSMSMSAMATTYDAATDFSMTNGNPNGAWTYGWSSSLTSALNVYSHPYVDGSGNQVWDDPNHVSLGAPSVFNNPTNNQQGTLPPHTAGFHPGSADEFSHYLWTAPTSGAFSISATFTPDDSGGTDVHVLDNGVSLFSGNVSPGNPQSYSGVVPLLAGDKIDFAVGFGPNGTFFNDATGIAATISSVPEPGACALATSGLVLLLALKRQPMKAQGSRPGK